MVKSRSTVWVSYRLSSIRSRSVRYIQISFVLTLQVSIKPLNSLEFAASCSNLADMGIMAVGNAKEERLKKISLRAHKDDVALALQDMRLLRNLLSLI